MKTLFSAAFLGIFLLTGTAWSEDGIATNHGDAIQKAQRYHPCDGLVGGRRLGGKIGDLPGELVFLC